jgi:hypothetical protein
MKTKKKVPKEVSAYFSKIGKAGYRAKVRKIMSKTNKQKGDAKGSL